jgi:L-arabinose transport system ATP-binding protein
MIAAEGLRYSDQVKDVSFGRRGRDPGTDRPARCGQNEIARLLGGDLQPDAGSIVIGGRKVVLRHPSDGRAAASASSATSARGKAFCPTSRYGRTLHCRRSASGGPAAYSSTGRRSAPPLAESVRQFGVVAGSSRRRCGRWRRQPAKALIARWHLAAAMAFVLIEPTHGVDVAARGEIYKRRLDALAAAGKALVVVSSEIAEVLAIADRILIIREA